MITVPRYSDTPRVHTEMICAMLYHVRLHTTANPAQRL